MKSSYRIYSFKHGFEALGHEGKAKPKISLGHEAEPKALGRWSFTLF